MYLFEAMPTLSLSEWRWGHLHHSVCQVLRRMAPLRHYWVTEKMWFETEAPFIEKVGAVILLVVLHDVAHSRLVA